MKVLINRRPKYDQCWGGGNQFLKAFCELTTAVGHEVVHEFVPDIDVVLMQDPRYDELGISLKEIAFYKTLFPKTRIVHRVNECDARKGTKGLDDVLRSCSKFSDATVFVSKWIESYHDARGWACRDRVVVTNGVDRNVFYPRDKTSDDVVKIVVAHWSDNELKNRGLN